MKTRIIIFVMLIACCFRPTAIAQVVTSVAGLNFGTDYYKAKNYLTNHFGYNNYEQTGDYLLTFRNVMVGGIFYDFADFYFKNNKFIAAYLYCAYDLTALDKAQKKREEIFEIYQKKYWKYKERIANGLKVYGMGTSMYDYDTDIFPISIIVEKGENIAGRERYFAGVAYYNHLIGGDNDI